MDGRMPRCSIRLTSSNRKDERVRDFFDLDSVESLSDLRENIK